MAFQQANLVNDLKYNDNRYLLKGTTAGTQTVDSDINFTGDVQFNGVTGAFFLKTEHISTSLGVADAGKPVITDATGLLSLTLIQNSGATWKLISPDSLLNPVFYTDNFGDCVVIGNLTTAGDLRVDGGQIGLSTDINLISMSNNLVDVSGRIQATGTAASIKINADGANDAVLIFEQTSVEKARIYTDESDSHKLKLDALAGIYLLQDTFISGDLQVNGGEIGTQADTDLLNLTSNLLTVNGSIKIDDNGYIGIDSQPTLLTLASNLLTLNGSLKLDDDAYIGIDNDTDLLQLRTNLIICTADTRISTGNLYALRNFYVGGEENRPTINFITGAFPGPGLVYNFIELGDSVLDLTDTMMFWKLGKSLTFLNNDINSSNYYDFKFLSGGSYYSVLKISSMNVLISSDLQVQNSLTVSQIGPVTDTDLISLSLNLLNVNGSLKLDNNSYIGIDANASLIQLTFQTTTISNDVSVLGNLNFLYEKIQPEPVGHSPSIIWDPSKEAVYFGTTGIGHFVQINSGGIQGVTGVQGETGLQGIQGVTGFQGETGIQGETGFGLQGETGVQGLQGETGVQGLQGETGVQGLQGETGVQGIQGVTGLQGETGIGIQGETGPSGGPIGATGVQGTTGTQGIDGQTGPAGGPIGATGVQGTTGTQGIQGVTGTQGIQGATGLQGQTGIQGIQGQTGTQGIQGQTGIQGYTGTGIQGYTGIGTQGQTGVQGLQGYTGVRGYTGVQGLVGNQGLQGHTGLEGTQGNIGLQGETGTQGIQGHTGIQGATGVQGCTGIQGSTGVQGVTGLQGVQGQTGLQGQTGVQGITGLRGMTGVQGTTGLQGNTGLQGQTGLGTQGATGLTGQTGVAGLTTRYSFCARNTTGTNVTGSGTTWTVTFTEVFDVGGNFASNTFTAPVAGYYQLQASLRATSLGVAGTSRLRIVAGGLNFDDYNIGSSESTKTFKLSVLVYMAQSDTAVVQFFVNGLGADTVDVTNAAGFFSGFLVE